MTLVDYPTAAFVACVPEATIRQWVRRGHLTAHGPRRKRTVDLDQLLEHISGKRPAEGETA